MAAQIMDGKILAAQIKTQVKTRVGELRAQGIHPCLAVVLVGENPASAVYVRGKQADCAECDIESRLIHLPAEVSEEKLLTVVETLAADQNVHGLLVQLPASTIKKSSRPSRRKRMWTASRLSTRAVC